MPAASEAHGFKVRQSKESSSSMILRDASRRDKAGLDSRAVLTTKPTCVSMYESVILTFDQGYPGIAALLVDIDYV